MGVELLQPEALAHQALEAGFVEQVVGEFFVGEHGESGALRSGNEFGGFFDCEALILANHGGDHADHDLQAADQAGFVVGCGIRSDIEGMIFVIGLFPRIHTSPFSQRYRPTDLDVMTPLDVVTIYLAFCACRDKNKTARKCWGIRR